MIKTVIFDFDGVIVESVDIKTRAFSKLFEDRGNEVRKKVVDYHLTNAGVSRYEKIKFIFTDILKEPLSEKKFKTLCGKFSSLVEDEVAAAPYVKGAKEFLEKNIARYDFFVVSATPQDEIQRIIRKRGDERFFRMVYGAPTDKKDAVKEILQNQGIMPSEAVYTGDALSDYAAANTCGVHFIARITDNEKIFEAIACPRITDLTGLERKLGKF